MNADTVRLFHVSDIHFGLEDPAALRWVEDCIGREAPDAVAITGDLTMRARHHEYEAAVEWISSLEVPATVEVGNHDLPYFNLWERFTDPYRRFRGIEGLIEREIDLPGLAIVSLRTTARAQARWPWVDGWIMPKALHETLDAIDALPGGTRVLVAAHHPLPERGEDGRLLTYGGTEAMEALAARGVLAVLSGHIHDPFDLTAQTRRGPLRMIGAGTLSQRLRTTPPSFNELTIRGDALEVEVRNLADIPTPAMQVDKVPEDVEPPGA
jgi:3',5'-cyclic AMP phosphodiesterase CpdA